jgi:hypothetical protein
MNLILLHWSLIIYDVVRYENIMLFNEIKFEELILMLVHTNLLSQTIRNLDCKIIFVAFNLHGSVYFLGLNIRVRKMQHFCLPCFLFNKQSRHFVQWVFTIDEFRNWKKVRNGKDCVFLNHIGKYHNSFHIITEKSYDGLKNQSQHIQNVLEKFTSEQIVKNRLQLKASIDVIRVLAF